MSEFGRIIILSIIFLHSVQSQDYPLVSKTRLLSNNENELFESWSTLYKETNEFIFPYKGRVINYIDYISSLKPQEINVTDKCIKSLQRFQTGLKNDELWAYKFLDTSSKGLPSGLSSMDITDFGDYDGCLDIEVNKIGAQFNGRYCMSRVHIPLPGWTDDNVIFANGSDEENFANFLGKYHKFLNFETFHMSFCIPSTCQKNDLQNILNKLTEKKTFIFEVRTLCDTRSEIAVNLLDLPFNVAFSLWTLLGMTILVIWSTAITAIFPKTIFSHFSIAENSKKLVSEDSNPRFSFLHLHKVITCIACLICHNLCGIVGGGLFYSQASIRISNLVETLEDPDNRIPPIITNLLYLVDPRKILSLILDFGFFFSGFTCFISWEPLLARMKGNISIFSYVLPRIIKVFPAILGALMINNLQILVGSGPVFREAFYNQTAPCVNNLFKSLFFNNQESLLETCLIPTWYLSVDLHLYLSSYIIVILLVKNRRSGIILSIFFITLAQIYTGYLVHHGLMPATTDAGFLNFKKEIINFSKLHFNLSSRFLPYYTGILSSYWIVNAKVNHSQKTWFFGWFIAGLFMVFFPIPTNLGATYATSNLILYISSQISRLFLLASLVWIVYAFSSTSGGFLRSIFTTKLVKIISRLSISVYVSHIIIVWYDTSINRKSLDVSMYSVMKRDVYVVQFCFVLGYFVFLLFEAPFISMAKRLKFSGKMNNTSNGDIKSNGHLDSNGHLNCNGQLKINGDLSSNGNLNSNGHLNNNGNTQEIINNDDYIHGKIKIN